jgi:hypothetical protein
MQQCSVVCFFKDEELAENMEQLLAAQGYDVLRVQSLAEAVYALRTLKEGCILTDKDISFAPEMGLMPLAEAAIPFHIYHRAADAADVPQLAAGCVWGDVSAYLTGRVCKAQA